jgi:hypothetical protein
MRQEAIEDLNAVEDLLVEPLSNGWRGSELNDAVIEAYNRGLDGFGRIQSHGYSSEDDDDIEPEAAPTAHPVDRSNRVLASGEPVPDDQSHTALKPSGQQQDYVVLAESERHKGYVRRYRDAYRHLKCGKITTMSRAIAETYARDPSFYTGTFCSTCCGHFPIGEDGEFVWYEMDGTTGPKVGT